ncbi:MAG: metallophosphoesterase family protein [Myxococcales bacterium]|nr:metallophosphoesterase family protein [Myxococcales bacterium]
MRGLAVLLLTLGAQGCFDYTPDVVPGVPDPGGAGGQGGAGGSGGAGGQGGQAPAEPVYFADCADAPDLAGAYAPTGCAHTVQHPEGITDTVSSCGAADADPTAVHVTFPTADPSTTVAIQWTTGGGTRLSEVRVGASQDALDQVFHGHSFTYDALEGRRLHEVHLCGLTPGRTYWYQVGGEGHFSPVHRFTTAPAPDSDDEYLFAITGDTRSASTNVLWTQLIESLSGVGVDAMLFSGDAVELGLVQAQWDAWFQAGGEGFASIPFIPTNGNHDLLTLNYLAQFALPRNEENFAYRYGNAVIISLNDFPLGDREALSGRTKQFLADTLEANKTVKWKFVLHHRPLFSASTAHGSATALVDEWMPLYDQYQVDAVFNGHDHNYERTRPIRNNQVVPPGQGTYYVVAAGVGAPMYDNGSQWWTAISESTPSYALLRVAGDRAEFTAYRLDGTVIDEFVMEK